MVSTPSSPDSEWQFAYTVDGKLTPSDPHIHPERGFQPGKIYEYVYAVDGLTKQHWILGGDRADLLRRGEREWDEAAM